MHWHRLESKDDRKLQWQERASSLEKQCWRESTRHWHISGQASSGLFSLCACSNNEFSQMFPLFWNVLTLEVLSQVFELSLKLSLSQWYQTLKPDLSQEGFCWALSMQENKGGDESNVAIVIIMKPIGSFLESSKLLFIQLMRGLAWAEKVSVELSGWLT